MLIQVQEKQVYYYSAGKAIDPQRPTVVFIHGAQNDHSVWNLQSRYFAYHGKNVVALDLPGHGRSAGPALQSVEALAEWLVAVLDTLTINKASLVGHSMGSLIALDTARIAGDRVERLALLGSTWPMKVADALLNMARDDESAAIDLVVAWSHLHTTQATASPGFNLQGSARQLMRHQSALNPDRLFYTDFAACNNYLQGDAAAARIAERQLPVLFVLGKQDRMTPPKAGAALRATLPAAHTVEIDQCGHSMMAEQPDAVLHALRRHLA